MNGERNFHIFYQLIRGLKSIKSTFDCNLTENPEDYNYLSQSRETAVANVSDAEVFCATRQCLHSVGITESTENQLYQLLSGILHFGNVTYDVDAAEGNIVTGNSKYYFYLLAKNIKYFILFFIRSICTHQCTPHCRR